MGIMWWSVAASDVSDWDACCYVGLVADILLGPSIPRFREESRRTTEAKLEQATERYFIISKRLPRASILRWVAQDQYSVATSQSGRLPIRDSAESGNVVVCHSEVLPSQGLF